MVLKKASRSLSRERARPVTSVTATSTRRPRAHALAPEHIGEAGSVAILALAVLGLALVIAALGVIVSGITLGGQYGANPPPNAGSLGLGQVIGGIGLLVLGICLVGAALAVLADVRRSRIVAASLAALAAILSAIGAVLVTAQRGATPVLPVALTLATLIFGASAVILGRPRR